VTLDLDILSGNNRASLIIKVTIRGTQGVVADLFGFWYDEFQI
jgi:hypothetical protein